MQEPIRVCRAIGSCTAARIGFVQAGASIILHRQANTRSYGRTCRDAWQTPQEVVTGRTDQNEVRQVDGKRLLRPLAHIPILLSFPMDGMATTRPSGTALFPGTPFSGRTTGPNGAYPRTGDYTSTLISDPCGFYCYVPSGLAVRRLEDNRRSLRVRL